MNKIPNDILVRDAFEKPQNYLKRTEANIQIRIETVAQFVANAQNKQILDIGCGDGSLSINLLNATNHVTLLDRSKSMLGVAAASIPKGLADRVRIINEDFNAFKFEGQSFDVIICVGVLAYVQDLKPFLKRITSVLKPGSQAILECSDGTHPLRRLARAYDGLRRKLGAADFKTVCRPKSEVLAAMKDLGFELQGSFRYSYPLPLIRRFHTQSMIYNGTRIIFGNHIKNRSAWLGSECIYNFVRKSASDKDTRPAKG